MGLIDGIAGALGSARQGAVPPGLNEHLGAMLNDPKTGGLAGLAQKFNAGGLGNTFASWVGTGANHPISAQQITSVLGATHLDQLAGKFGMSSATLSAMIATTLPGLINRMTPNGQIPPTAAAPTPTPILAPAK